MTSCVLAVADTDSYLKWSAATLRRLPADWPRTQLVLRNPVQPSAQQIAAAGAGAVELVMTSAWTGLAAEGGADDGPPADADFTAEANPCDDGLGVGTEPGTDDEAPDEATL